MPVPLLVDALFGNDWIAQLWSACCRATLWVCSEHLDPAWPYPIETQRGNWYQQYWNER